ncbi:hypothetical protein Tco_1000232 [Tanacetum coccineum]
MMASSDSPNVCLSRPFISKFHLGGVGHNIHIGSLIDEGVHVLKVPYAARYFKIPSDVLLLCYLFLENRSLDQLFIDLMLQVIRDRQDPDASTTSSILQGF